MLLKFKVSNFASFKEEVVLDFIPSSDKKHLDFISENGKDKALNCIALYGANASGKSNLIKAITASIMTIRESGARQISDKIFRMTPFIFDNSSIKEPCFFEYTFVAENNIKYVYGFSATQDRIFEEYLYEYTSAKPSMIFELNSETREYEYPKAESKTLGPIVDRNTNNKLLLSSATNWNYEKTKPAFNWFISYIDTYDNLSGSLVEHFDRYTQNDGFEDLKEMTIKLLHAADINISDYNIINNKINLTQQTGLISSSGFIRQNLSNPNSAEIFDIYTNHVVDNQRKYQLNIREESSGTISLFGFAPVIEKATRIGKTIIVDELEKSLHPSLSKMLIELFRNTSLNHSKAQLVFSTHSTNLLDLDLFRKDQIFFTEKDPKTGVSDLYSLSDFRIRTTENIENGYLLGRYGAIPYIHPEDLYEQETE